MTISHRRLRAGLRALGNSPSPTPDAAFVARLDLHLRQVDLDELVVPIEPVPAGRSASRAPSDTVGGASWWNARVAVGRRTPLRLAVLAVGATFATAATAAAFVIAQPASRVKVEDPAERPTISVTTAVVTTTTVASTTTAAVAGGNPSGGAPALIAPLGTTTTRPTSTTPTSTPATTPTTTEARRPTTAAPLPVTTTKPTEPPHPTTTDSPGAPVTISLTCTGRRVGTVRSVLCEWSAADGAANYRVLRGDGRLLVPVQGTLRYEDLAVTGDVTYTYLAQAVAADGVTIVANSNRASVACCLPA